MLLVIKEMPVHVWMIKNLLQGEQGWCSGESTRLPPMWPGFKSRCWSHMWVEFVIGSLPCPVRFFSVTRVFPSHQKPTTLPNSNSIWNPWTRLNEFIRTPNYFVGKQITIITIASEAGRGLFLSSPFSLVMRDLCRREEIKFPVE